jgi:trk system potassium uptake protein TrkA
MRVVFVGASSLALTAARLLVERGHEVVFVDLLREKLDALSDVLDVGLLHGDGTRPDVLREADPKATHVLFCLTPSDQVNLIASLVGRTLGFPRIVTRIEDDEFEHVAIQLGLEDTVVPARAMGRYLADLVEGANVLELTAALKGDARVFLFVAREEDEGSVEQLGLPKTARVTHLYRGGRFLLADADTGLEAGDEVVVLTDRDTIDRLAERFGAGRGGSA